MLSPNSKGFLKIFTVHDTSIEPKQEATSVLSDLKGYSFLSISLKLLTFSWDQASARARQTQIKQAALFAKGQQNYGKSIKIFRNTSSNIAIV